MTYKIKIIDAMRPEIWYASKIGREFKAKLVEHPLQELDYLVWKVGPLLYVRPFDARIISPKREINFFDLSQIRKSCPSKSQKAKS